MNCVQFQSDLSTPDFLKQFGTEAQCEAELKQARWPQGFVFPAVLSRVIACLKLNRIKRFGIRFVGNKLRSLRGLSSTALVYRLIFGNLPHQPSQDRLVRSFGVLTQLS